uniref:Uncharacterized protein n=1 Tax=Arundo donax TaxID=35708 RepID=A0A0A8YH57_ARUDO
MKVFRWKKILSYNKNSPKCKSYFAPDFNSKLCVLVYPGSKSYMVYRISQGMLLQEQDDIIESWEST